MLGYLIFKEQTNVIWWTGAIMIGAGFYFVMSDEVEQKNKIN